MMLPNEYAKIANVNKKVIGKMKDELRKGYMKEFVAVSPKVYAFKESRIDDIQLEHKQAKGTNKTVTKKTLCFDMCKQCILENKSFNCIQYRIKSNPLSTDTLLIDKIALNNHNDKRLRSYNGVTTYPYGSNAFEVCYEELQFKNALAHYLNNI